MSETRVSAEDLVDFCNALESACIKLRRQIEAVENAPSSKGSAQLPFDVSKIEWKDRNGEKGPFQLSEDYMNEDHKALVKFLAEQAGGCVDSKDSQGRTWFYWLFPKRNTVGRRPRNKKT
jgi:hypothetical protein